MYILYVYAIMAPAHESETIVFNFRKTKMLWPGQENTIKKTIIYLEVKDQGPTKVIMVCDTPPYGHTPTDRSMIFGMWVHDHKAVCCVPY
jgi:hypothetical protein